VVGQAPGARTVGALDQDGVAVAQQGVDLGDGGRGIIEAFEDFRVPSIVRMYLGVANFVAPMLVSLFSQSLVPLVASILISRAVGLFMLYFNVRKKMHALRTNLGSQALQASTPAQRRSIRVQLNRFGKWMTVSNIAHPLLMQSDRFIIASAISAAMTSACLRRVSTTWSSGTVSTTCPRTKICPLPLPEAWPPIPLSERGWRRSAWKMESASIGQAPCSAPITRR